MAAPAVTDAAPFASGASGFHPSNQLSQQPYPQPLLEVVATTTVLADLAANVGGDLVAVSTLVPAGADVHTFQSTPADSLRISNAGVIVSNGAGLDIEDQLKNVAASYSFQVSGHWLEVYGRCQKCVVAGAATA